MPSEAPIRLTFYHLCGTEIYAEAVPNEFGPTYHFAYYNTRTGCTPADVCRVCHSRVGRKSVRLPGEQFLAEIAQELLELELDRQRRAEAEAAGEDTDA